jgi:MoxR-like ATPase
MGREQHARRQAAFAALVVPCAQLRDQCAVLQPVGQALMLATRARALLQGRLSPSIDDVVALAHPVLRHRIALTYSARAEGVTLAAVIDRLVALLG